MVTTRQHQQSRKNVMDRNVPGPMPINYRRAELDIARPAEDILAALDQLGRKLLRL